jgi:hypothetical protein
LTWIKLNKPGPDNPELVEAMAAAMQGYPDEYGPPKRDEGRLPDLVMADSIVASHSLIPGALHHVFAAYGAMMSPDLPLDRRQHEMIAATVSALNRCFY